jgi:hypothetical protein
MITLWSTAGADFLINNDSTSFVNEGIVLRLANTTNPAYRAFAVVSADGTKNNWYAAKSGYTLSRGGVNDMIHSESTTIAGLRFSRVGEPGAADTEQLVIGSDINTPSAFEITTGKSGTGSTRPLIFSVDGTERFRVDGTAGIVLNGNRIRSGSGNPNGSVNGSPGEMYLNTSGGAGTTLWIKEAGAGTNTGWVGK